MNGRVTIDQRLINDESPRKANQNSKALSVVLDNEKAIPLSRELVRPTQREAVHLSKEGWNKGF